MNLWDRLFRRQKRDEELDEEVQAHLQMAAQERIESGESAWLCWRRWPWSISSADVASWFSSG